MPTKKPQNEFPIGSAEWVAYETELKKKRMLSKHKKTKAIVKKMAKWTHLFSGNSHPVWRHQTQKDEDGKKQEVVYHEEGKDINLQKIDNKLRREKRKRQRERAKHGHSDPLL
jgi:hypothetical protein